MDGNTLYTVSGCDVSFITVKLVLLHSLNSDESDTGLWCSHHHYHQCYFCGNTVAICP